MIPPHTVSKYILANFKNFYNTGLDILYAEVYNEKHKRGTKTKIERRMRTDDV